MLFFLAVACVDVLDLKYTFKGQELLEGVLECPPCQHGLCDRAVVAEGIVVKSVLQFLRIKQIVRKPNRLPGYNVDHFCKNGSAQCIYARICNGICPDECGDFVKKAIETIVVQYTIRIPIGHVIDRNKIGPHTVGSVVQNKEPAKNSVREALNILILHIIPEICKIDQIFKSLVIF